MVHKISASREIYKMKKVRVVSLVHDNIPSGPLLYPYQILSNYLKQYWSYGMDKISASGELTNEEVESCLSCM